MSSNDVMIYNKQEAFLGLVLTMTSRSTEIVLESQVENRLLIRVLAVKGLNEQQ